MISLGIDTSNYTTSLALYDSKAGLIKQCRKLLPVKPGATGLRQSDAVFLHTKALPELTAELFDNVNIRPDVIGVSTKSTDRDGSYMPCFLTGEGLAKSLGSILNIPVYEFSHQAGHIAAAALSAKRTELFDGEFIAFHISGGTTDAVKVSPAANMQGFDIKQCGGSSDLHAGQAIDRVGTMLSLPFPAGPALDALSLKCDKKIKVHTSAKGSFCSLSGLENKCRKMFDDGVAHSEIAKYCLEYIAASIRDILNGTENCGTLPVLFSGGVMSNTIIRERLSRFPNAVFALPEFSTDNAAGTAYLAARI